VQGADEVIIVEGELDKLAVEEALMQVAAAAANGTAATPANGIAGSAGMEASDPTAFMACPEGGRRAVISVPAGAPSRVSGPATSQERKFKFVSVSLAGLLRGLVAEVLYGCVTVAELLQMPVSAACL
jgi:septal ring-binding cell division protein DamX